MVYLNSRHTKQGKWAWLKWLLGMENKESRHDLFYNVLKNNVLC